MKNYRIYVCFLAIMGAVILITRGEYASSGALSSLKLAGEKLVPRLFPFMAIGYIFVKGGGIIIFEKLFGKLFSKIFGVSGKCVMPFIIGLISGYPTAAAVTASAVKRGEISPEEASGIIGWCSNPGIMFVLGCVGGHGIRDGLIVWMSCVFSGIIIGILQGRKRFVKIMPKAEAMPVVSAAECFVNSIKEAASNIIIICGFVIFFGTFLYIAEASEVWEKTARLFGADGEVFGAAANSLFEIVAGSVKVRELMLSAEIKIPIMAMIFAWSGISIHAQVAAVTSGSNINLRPYIKTKIMQSLIAPIVAIILVKAVPLEIPVSYITQTHYGIKIFSLTFMCGMLLWSVVLLGASVFLKNNGGVKK